jgi:hypothetical protein
MLKSLILGAILGALTAFLWSFISWSVLPWHQKQLHSFQNEDDVIAILASRAPESGNYLLPTGPNQGMNADQKKAAEEVRAQKMQKGPLVFAAVRKEGFGSFPKVLRTRVALRHIRRATAHLDAHADQRPLLRAPCHFPCHRGPRRQRHRQSPQLELAGLLRRLHRREPNRLPANLAARRPSHRQSRQAAGGSSA